MAKYASVLFKLLFPTLRAIYHRVLWFQQNENFHCLELFRTFWTSPKDHWVTSSVPPSTLWTHTQVLCSLIFSFSFHFIFLQEIVFLCHHQLPYSSFWTHTPLWPLIFPFIKWHNRICSRNCVSCRHQVQHIFWTSTGRQARSSLNIEALVIIFV